MISNVPNNDLRDGQHFTDYGYSIYDPLTARPCTAADGNCHNSPYIRQPFAGNAIPASRISPVGATVLNYYPKANGPDPRGLTQNFYANTDGRYRYDQPMFRHSQERRSGGNPDKAVMARFRARARRDRSCLSTGTWT